MAGSLLATGCGGFSAAGAESTAQAWVAAVNQRDWAAACDLTRLRPHDCERWLRASFPDGGVRIDGVRRDGEVLLVSLSTPLTRGEKPPPSRGWTAYAPLELPVDRADGEHRVHPEIATIR